MGVIIVCVPVLMSASGDLGSLSTDELSQIVMSHASSHLSNLDFSEIPTSVEEASAPPPHTSCDKVASLTPRETEVLVQIANGKTYKEVARILGISPHTVSGYKKEIYRKLDISSVAAATQVVLKSQLAA